MSPGAGVTLEGVVRSVRSWDTGWAIMDLTPDGGSAVKVVGHGIAHLARGQRVTIQGKWTDNPQYGRQFTPSRVDARLPESSAGLEHWLAGVEGVGPVTARRIVRALGAENLLNRLRDQPELLAKVEGVGSARAQALAEAVRDTRARDELAIELGNAGVPPHLVSAILRRYGVGAPEVVRRDPYSLRVRGWGFQTADAVGQRLGFAPDAPERLRGGVLRAMGDESQRGHTYVPGGRVAGVAAKLLGVSAETVSGQVGAMIRDGPLERDGPRSEAVYLPRLRIHESQAAARLLALLARRMEPAGWPSPAADLGMAGDVELSEEQRSAIRLALSSPAGVAIITGGPGTGKTTITRAIVEAAEHVDLTVELASPTGRAAKRLSEATGRTARTLHRLLEYHPPLGRFRRHAGNPIGAELVLVDEVSMVDVSLLRHLLVAIHPDSRLVLVGDADQLPSVGPGRCFADLVESNAVPTARLTTIYRQAAGSAIVRASHAVRAGRAPGWPPPDTDPRPDLYMVRIASAESGAEMVRRLVSERIPRAWDVPAREIQVLAPTHRGALGVKALNKVLQEAANPRGRPLVGRPGLRTGDRVMQMKNNYELGVFNGDVGWLLGEDVEDGQPAEGTARVEFPGPDGSRVVSYPRADAGELALAYASTIHKFQGSQQDAVVLCVHRSHGILLERHVIYTGMTRAARLLVVVGTDEAMARAASNDRGKDRRSHLADRILRPEDFRPAPERGGDGVDGIESTLWVCRRCSTMVARDMPGEPETPCSGCGERRWEEVKDQ